MTHKTLIQKLEEIDDELVYLEDITGAPYKEEIGDIVTDVRDMIMDLVNELMDDETFQ